MEWVQILQPHLQTTIKNIHNLNHTTTIRKPMEAMPDLPLHAFLPSFSSLYSLAVMLAPALPCHMHQQLIADKILTSRSALAPLDHFKGGCIGPEVQYGNTTGPRADAEHTSPQTPMHTPTYTHSQPDRASTHPAHPITRLISPTPTPTTLCAS